MQCELKPLLVVTLPRMKGGDDISEDLYKSSISVAKTGDTNNPIHPPSLRSNTCWYGMICRSTITWDNGYHCSILSLLLLRQLQRNVSTQLKSLFLVFSTVIQLQRLLSVLHSSQSWSKTSLCSCTLSSSRINTPFSSFSLICFSENCGKNQERKLTQSKSVS